MNAIRKTPTMLGVMAALSLFCAIPLLGQSADVSDAKLEAVAKAYVQVMEIQNTYRPQIEAAQTPEEAQRLQREADEKMVAAIRVYMTVDEYTGIMTAAEQDENLRNRLLVHIDREQGQSGG